MEVTGVGQRLISSLRARLRQRTIILGIGNPLREDDGIGPYFASLCRPRPGLSVYDCGETPENYSGKIRKEKPEHLLLVDATDFGGIPGEVRLLTPETIITRGISTHDMSLRLFVESLQDEGIEIRLLAFQPQSLRLGHEPTAELLASAQRIAAGLGIATPGEGGGL